MAELTFQCLNGAIPSNTEEQVISFFTKGDTKVKMYNGREGGNVKWEIKKFKLGVG